MRIIVAGLDNRETETKAGSTQDKVKEIVVRRRLLHIA